MKKNFGFTLIELMVVISVIAILSTIALFGLNSAQKAARDTQRTTTMRGIRTALECYYSVMGLYPDPATFNWGALNTTLNPTSPATTCFSLATVKDPYNSGTASTGTTTWSVATTPAVTYVYARPTTSTYTLTLTGESKTSTFSSPN